MASQSLLDHVLTATGNPWDSRSIGTPWCIKSLMLGNRKQESKSGATVNALQAWRVPITL